MNKIKQQSQGSIGKPTDVTHKLHVDFGVRIQGLRRTCAHLSQNLPAEWKSLLEGGGFKPEDFAKYTEELRGGLQVLNPKPAQQLPPQVRPQVPQSQPKPQVPNNTGYPQTPQAPQPTAHSPSNGHVMPTATQETDINIDELVSQDNPLQLFTDYKKIGEGCLYIF